MAYYSTLTDTLFVGSLDLHMIPGVIVERLDQLHAPGTRRGLNDTVPGRRGQLGVRKPLDAYAFAIPITIYPTGENGTIAQRRAMTLNTLRATMAALMGTGGLVTLTRRLTTATGDLMTVAAGEFVDGLAIEWLNAEAGRTELNFVNLEGCWYATYDDVLTPGNVIVAGDVETHRITLTLPGPGTLTNTTAGASVTVTTGAVLDVENFDASAGLATLTTTGSDPYWFTLLPGSNAITWTGTGSPSIGYRAAYL